MSQIGVFIPCHGAEGAACVKQSIEAAHCYTGLRVVKLRTGPSVTARLDALEADILDHRTRLGDLESDSGGMARAREIEALKDAAFGPVAPVRPEPGSVAEPTDDDLGRIARAQANSLGYAAAGRALYDLGREHGRAGLHAERTTRDEIAAQCAALLARAEKAEKAERQLARWVQEACDVGEALKPYRVVPGAAFLSRADDIRDLVADWQKRGEELEALRTAMTAPEPTTPDATHDPLTDLPADLRAMHEKACAHYMAAEHKSEFDRGIAEGIRIVEIHVGAARDATRPSAPTPIVRVPTESAGADGARLVLSEAEMAAELEVAGWFLLREAHMAGSPHQPERWTNPKGTRTPTLEKKP